jgi:hypothetical protein
MKGGWGRKCFEDLDQRRIVSPAKWLRRPTPTEDSARCDPESLGFSLYKMHSL